MPAPATAVVTGTFPAAVTASPVYFVPSAAIVFDGSPELLPSSPVSAKISAGALTAMDGTPLALPVTSAGTPVGPTGFWYWTAKNVPGVSDFSFFLTGNSDITGLINSPLPLGTAYLPLAGGTMTGKISPAVVTLTDAATIAADASLGNDFRVTLGGNRTIGAPSNPADGQDVTFLLTQDATGGRTVTWNAVYDFGTDGAPTLTTTAAKRDLVGFKYVAAASAWVCTGWKLGF